MQLSPDAFAALNGLTFAQPALLVEALTHPSYVNETRAGASLRDNQRLEYLGDAVLNLIVADELFHRHPDWDEGYLTRARVALVRAETLAAMARECQIDQALLIGGGDKTELHTNLNVQADAFEAVIGALFVDGGLEAARAFSLPLLRDRIDELAALEEREQPRTALQERAQRLYGITPRYRVISEAGMPHEVIYSAEVLIGERIIGVGSGHGKQAAFTSAALDALAFWDERMADWPER